jgi:RNA polymerase sigma factor (sigma-70 family)
LFLKERFLLVAILPLSSFGRRLEAILPNVRRRLQVFRSVQARFGVSDIIQEVLRSDCEEFRNLDDEELQNRILHRARCRAAKLRGYHNRPKRNVARECSLLPGHEPLALSNRPTPKLPPEEAAAAESERLLEQALNKLSSQERAVIQLRQEGMLWEQIAKRIGLNRNQCRYLQRLAHQTIQAALRKEI